MTDLIQEVPAAIEKALEGLLAPDEQVMVKLKGAFKEALVCTDRRVIIVKGGFMTGQMFGTDAFQSTYGSIAGVQVKFSILSGYVEVSAGGMQNTQKSYWSTNKTSDPSKAPNCVALNSKAQAEVFRQAAAFILQRAEELRNGSAAAAPAHSERDSALDALQKLGALRDAGVLTEEEFTAKKAQLLEQL